MSTNEDKKRCFFWPHFDRFGGPFWYPFGSIWGVLGGEFGIENRLFFGIPLQTPPRTHFDRFLVDFGAPKGGFGTPFGTMLAVWEENLGCKIVYFLHIHLQTPPKTHFHRFLLIFNAQVRAKLTSWSHISKTASTLESEGACARGRSSEAITTNRRFQINSMKFFN